MLFVPMLLGLLATQLPFISLMLIMFYCGRTIQLTLISPARALGLFFLMPLMLLVWVNSVAIQVLSGDAILGVGTTVMVFMYAIRRIPNLNAAFTVAAAWLIGYGVIRYLLWGSFLAQTQLQGIDLAREQLSRLMDVSVMEQTSRMIQLFWPAMWTGMMMVALFAGYILFQRQMGLSFSWQLISFPAHYNLLLLISLPLYFFASTQGLFLNILVVLCVLPFIQGVGVMVNKLGALVKNNIIRGILMVAILVNIISYVLITILGFADMWWDFRKINTGGNPE